jgi:hypothetical protein
MAPVNTNFLVTGKQDTYFVRHHSDNPYKFSEADIKSILGFLVDNIYVVFGICMGTNCAPLLADLFLYSYDAEFVQKLLRDNKKPSTIHLDISTMSDKSTIIIFTFMST